MDADLMKAVGDALLEEFEACEAAERPVDEGLLRNEVWWHILRGDDDLAIDQPIRR
jgi:hypothetical protein